MSTWLLAGLGNPGRQYEETRHNIGFLVAEAFARQFGAVWESAPARDARIAPIKARPGLSIVVAKPQTFMNESGRAVGALARYFRIPPERTVVIYDELNLPFGRLKVSLTGSAGGHNGLKSIIAALEPGFVRYRIGIGPRQPTGISLTDFVLGKIPSTECKILEEKMAEYVAGLQLLIDRGSAAAMNQLNRKTPPDESDQKAV